MWSGDLPLLKESKYLKNRITTAVEQNGALYYLFWENQEFRALVQDKERVSKDFDSPKLVIKLEIVDFFNISNPKANNKG